MSNRLASSTSPYLLQHQDNPVDWFPWSEEALQLAREKDLPIFLSIGYSACHWCHVMAHESFENAAIAALLNQNFVSIKVDREQRPDLDQVYMQAVQMLTGSGGWPMSVFLTPDGMPFYGGTYWPPHAKWGRPGFEQVLAAIATAWREQRDALENQGKELAQYIQANLAAKVEGSSDGISAIGEKDLLRAITNCEEQFEMSYGGFGDAPKFPHTMDLELLMRAEKRNPSATRRQGIVATLNGMAHGGIFDHLGGGFSRYSVDLYWLVPHFEKMLYDNALLIRTYVDAFRLFQDSKYLAVAVDCARYLVRDLRHDQGSFFSAEDADSEGKEGKFYVWSEAEIQALLSDQSLGQPFPWEMIELFCQVYGVTAQGNFEEHDGVSGNNVLNIIGGPREARSRLQVVAEQRGMAAEELDSVLAPLRLRLFHARATRVRPGLDDKILVAWNALAIDAFSQLGSATGESRWISVAVECAEFLVQHLIEGPTIWHVWRNGTREIHGFLDDYAYLAHAFLSLHQTTQSAHWLDLAISTTESMIALFSNSQSGGFVYVANHLPRLIAETRDDIDHSIPSGSGMAATVLAKLAGLTGDSRWYEAATATIQASAPLLRRSPGAAGQFWIALDALLHGNVLEIVAIPKSLENEHLKSHADIVNSILHQCGKEFEPHRSLLITHEGVPPHPVLAQALADKHPIEGKTTSFTCVEHACQPPRHWRFEPSDRVMP